MVQGFLVAPPANERNSPPLFICRLSIHKFYWVDGSGGMHALELILAISQSRRPQKYPLYLHFAGMELGDASGRYIDPFVNVRFL